MSGLGGIISVRDLRNLQSLARLLKASLLSKIIELLADSFWIIGRYACTNIFDIFLCDTFDLFSSNSYARMRLLALDELKFSCSTMTLMFLTAPGLSGLRSSDLSVMERAWSRSPRSW